MRRHKDPSRRQLKPRRPPQPRQPPQARGHCTRYVAVHPNRRGVMPTVRVRCLLEQVKMWSDVARSGLCGLMGVCVVVPGGGFRQTVDPFTKIPRNLAVFAQWVCTLAEWMLCRRGCASWPVLGRQVCILGWCSGVRRRAQLWCRFRLGSVSAIELVADEILHRISEHWWCQWVVAMSSLNASVGVR